MVTLYRVCSLLTFLGPSTEQNDKCPNTLLYSLTSGILNLLYTLNPKKVPLPGGASQYRPVWEVPSGGKGGGGGEWRLGQPPLNLIAIPLAF